MNYYGARQRRADQRWDYTCRNGNSIWAVGYCAGWEEYTDEDEARTPGILAEQERQRPLKELYHRDGHDNAEEACACYRRYLLDTTLRFDCVHPEFQKKCLKCGAWTTKAATVADRPFDLCEEHLTREVVEELYPSVGTIVSSY